MRLQARGKTEDEVSAMLNQGIYDMQHFKDGGWVTDLLYGDQVIDMLSERYGNEPVKKKKKDEGKKGEKRATDNGAMAAKKPEKKLTAVTFKQYKNGALPASPPPPASTSAQRAVKKDSPSSSSWACRCVGVTPC